MRDANADEHTRKLRDGHDGGNAEINRTVAQVAERSGDRRVTRQQRIEGRVVVLVLVDENGQVAESRLQQGVSQAAVNNAVVSAVKNAKFRAATKNGIPVKMWRPIIVEVKP